MRWTPAPVDTLQRLAARYSMSPSRRRPFRSAIAYTAAGFYAHPADIEPLVDLLASKLHLLTAESLTYVEECRIAAFAMSTVMLIRPFESANARTAVAFAQHLLSHRNPDVELHPDAHIFLSEAFAGTEILAPTASPEDLLSLKRRMTARIVAFNLAERSGPAEFATQYLLQCYSRLEKRAG